MNIIDCIIVTSVLVALTAWAWTVAPADPHDCPCGDCTPEAPALTPPIRRAMAVRERILQSEDLRERRTRWEDRQEIERLCADVSEGREP
jgi:hypothetical protein